MKQKRKVKDDKNIYKVSLATPRYYVLEKDGEYVRVDKKNSYKRGDALVYKK